MPHELILASHRLPIEVQHHENGLQVRPSPGGLARALNDLLQQHPGSWIGYPGTEGPIDIPADMEPSYPYGMIPIQMGSEEIENHYRGFSNQILWPLFHDLHPYCDFEPRFWDTYQRVNRRYARTIAQTGDEDQIVWVHDYHLMLVPHMLREYGDTRPLGFFLHTPFPSVETLQRLPWHHELLDSLLHAGLVGFQTTRDLANFTHAVGTLISDVQVQIDGPRAHIETDAGQLEAAVFPIGIDDQAIARQADSPGIEKRLQAAKSAMGTDQTCIVGVERLDYTKGIPERLRAFHQALSHYPHLRGKVTLVQHINPSREDLPLYQELKTETERLVGQINGVFSTLGWTPVRYSYGSLDYEDVLTLYRLGDVALVTPLRDGMNLVCKEYCMAKGDAGGVLILSQFAGAAEQLGDQALLVNPHDIDQMAWAINKACTMPENQRRDHMTALQEQIRAYDVHAWAKGFLDSLMATKQKKPELDTKPLAT